MNMKHWWNDIDGGKPNDRRKTWPSATLSTAIPIWTNLGPHGKKVATNDLSFGLATVWAYTEKKGNKKMFLDVWW
jgi:hypothetical protein